MASDATVSIGPCNVFINDVNVGFTKGGVAIAIATTTKPVSFDNFGNLVKREYITDRTAKISWSFSDGDLGNLAIALPGVIYYNNSLKMIRSENVQGIELISASSVSLRLRPIDSTGDASDVYFPKVYTTGETSFSFKHDAEKLFPIDFNAVIDDNTGILFRIGSAVVNTLADILKEDGGYILFDDNTVFILEES